MTLNTKRYFLLINPYKERETYMLITYYLISVTLLSMLLISSLIIYQLNRKRKDQLLLKLTSKWNNYLDLVIFNERSPVILDQNQCKQLESPEELMAFLRASENFIDSGDTLSQERFTQFIHDNKRNWITLAILYEKKIPYQKHTLLLFVRN